MDDWVLGTGRVEERIAKGPGWERVPSWEALSQAVLDAGRGATAFVLWRQSSGTGHAFAVHHTADAGVQWVEPPAGSGYRRVSPKEPERDAHHARAVVVDGTGRVLQDALRGAGSAPDDPFTRPAASRSRVAALTDPPRSLDYAAMGWEVEDRHILLGPEMPKGTLLAQNAYLDVVIGFAEFFRAGDGVWHATIHDAVRDAPPGQSPPERDSFAIVEFVSKKSAGLLEEILIPFTESLAHTERARDELGLADSRNRVLPLWEALTPENGWTITEHGQEFSVAPAIGGSRHPAYTHITTGTVPSGLTAALGIAKNYAHGSANVAPFFFGAERFGQKIALLYVREITGDPLLEKNDLHLLRSIPEIDEVWGYSWLFFSHVSANPLQTRFFPSEFLVKNIILVGSRTPFGVRLGALHPRVQDFFSRNHDLISWAFTGHLRQLIQDYRTLTRSRAPDDTGHLMSETTWSGLTTQEFLTAVLRGHTSQGTEVSQNETVGITDHHERDDNEGTLEFAQDLIEYRALNRGGNDLRMPPEDLRLIAEEIHHIVQRSYRRAETFPEPLSHTELSNSIATIRQHRAVQVLQSFVRAATTPLPNPQPGGPPQGILSEPQAMHLSETLGAFALGLPPDPSALHFLTSLINATNPQNHPPTQPRLFTPHIPAHLAEQATHALHLIHQETTTRNPTTETRHYEPHPTPTPPPSLTTATDNFYDRTPSPDQDTLRPTNGNHHTLNPHHNPQNTHQTGQETSSSTDAPTHRTPTPHTTNPPPTHNTQTTTPQVAVTATTPAAQDPHHPPTEYNKLTGVNTHWTDWQLVRAIGKYYGQYPDQKGILPHQTVNIDIGAERPIPLGNFLYQFQSRGKVRVSAELFNALTSTAGLLVSKTPDKNKKYWLKKARERPRNDEQHIRAVEDYYGRHPDQKGFFPPATASVDIGAEKPCPIGLTLHDFQRRGRVHVSAALRETLTSTAGL
ncbi:hypothetical protein ACIGYQ_46935, partial [Streptomyces sp. NPDC053726]